MSYCSMDFTPVNLALLSLVEKSKGLKREDYFRAKCTPFLTLQIKRILRSVKFLGMDFNLRNIRKDG